MKISKSFSIKSIGIILGALSVLILTNCSRSPDQNSVKMDDEGVQLMVAPTFSSLYQNVLSPKCMECHRPGGSANAAGSNVDFSNPTFGYTSIVNQAVSGITSASVCSGAIIASNTAAKSYLLAIFFPEYGLGGNNWSGIAGCTPFDHTVFQTSVPSSGEKSALVQWLNAGSPNN